MVFRSVLRFASLIAVLALASIAHADYVGPFTETWSDDGDLEGWTGYTLDHDDVNDRLYWTEVDGLNNAFLYATSNSSASNHYLGNLTGAGAISFDIGADAGCDMHSISISMWSPSSGNYTGWIYELPVVPAPGQSMSYTVLLDSPNWTLELGSLTLEETLADVDSFVLAVAVEPETQSTGGWLDNFGIGDAPAATTPEPGTMTLVMLGLGSLGYLRRRKSAGK